MENNTAPDSNRGLISVNIDEEMRGAYLDYAMSVIIGRALPDVRDGLKPVHRRALFAMHELNNGWNKPYKKSARVVGDVIGKYHPHGDGPVYETIVRMAQEFSLRYPLVDGQGNFGSIDGDSAAAMRYTEVRMAKVTEDLLSDLEKETVDFGPNYDGSLTEPHVFPSRIPNLLVNGSTGIAVGMATNIPPHNMGEVVEACIHLIDQPTAEIDDLLKYIKGPDFPTRGIIIATQGLKRAYHTGKGVIIIRGRAEIEKTKNDRERIVITELPYQVNKARLIEKIAEHVKEGRITAISDLRDESNRAGIRVVIDLKKGEQGNIILNQLYKMTQLQESFGISLLAIHHQQPKLFNIKDALSAFIDHRREVVVRRTIFELKKAESRLHLLEGLKIAVENIDEVIAIIKAAENPKSAQAKLIERFSFSDIQSQAILDMRLQKITGLERDKIIEEYHEILQIIEKLRAILASDLLIKGIIKEELKEVVEKFGDERRTEIMIDEETDFDIEDLIPNDPALITMTHRGYIKRQAVDVFKSQNRGGKGLTAVGMEDGDFVTQIFSTTLHSSVFCFTNTGRVYSTKVYKIPDSSRVSKGKAIINLLNLRPDETIVSVVPVAEVQEGQYVISVTKNGLIKKTELIEFKNLRAGGIVGVVVDEGDQLVSIQLCDNKSEIILCSQQGQSIRFQADELRSVGRKSMGVIGMRLSEDDYVVGMAIISGEELTSGSEIELLAVSENGFGKKTPIEEYRSQSRGGRGVKAIKVNERNGGLLTICRVVPNLELMLVSSRGKMIKIKVSEISSQGRNSMGVKLMNVDAGERVVAAETMVAPPELVNETTDEVIH